MKAALPDYRIRSSPKAKTLRLKVTREDGLLVVVPKGYDETKIPALLTQKRLWVADAIERIGETKRFLEPKPVTHLPGTLRLLALGETWSITYREAQGHSGIRLRAENNAIVVSASAWDRDAVVRKLKTWLRAKVRAGLFPLAEDLANRHRLNVGGMLVKSQRTRWASCSAQKNLSLNTKLLFLSPELVRYVLVHELCHTVHMSHSREFWRLLASNEPRCMALDRKLRDAWKGVPPWMF